MQSRSNSGLGPISVLPAKVDTDQLASFETRLNEAGVDTSCWGLGCSKSVEHLFWELFQRRGCILVQAFPGMQLKRVTRVVKVNLVAEIFGVDHSLLSRSQFLCDAGFIERRRPPLRKLRWCPPCCQQPPPSAPSSVAGTLGGGIIEFGGGTAPAGSSSAAPDCAVLYAEDCPLTEPWRVGCRELLAECLGLSPELQEKHLVEDLSDYSYHVEECSATSSEFGCGSSYPGLPTTCCIHEVTLRIRDPEDPDLLAIGLPEGQEFATTEGDFNASRQQDDGGLSVGTQLNVWTWIRERTQRQESSSSSSAQVGAKVSLCSSPGGSNGQEKARPSRRVPMSAACDLGLRGLRERLANSVEGPPNGALVACMSGVSTDWRKVRRIARRILDPDYTLQKYYQDLSAFPELSLYLLEDGTCSSPPPSGVMGAVPSGRTTSDEYQRTIGAFFAIYWMMRMDLDDGREGFANGVDAAWAPIRGVQRDDARVTFPEKRRVFLEQAEWAFFRSLLSDAGLVEQRVERGACAGSRKRVVVNERRLVSLLALTAVHDVMKNSLLLPTVQREHAPYHGYKAGDTIADHDHALMYVMEHFPHLLPSFRDLAPQDKRAVLFTKCKLCFNHGWFVQAEAPPGAALTQIREALIRDHKSQIGQRDVALYFVHWLTDLAGGEPTPLAGCEKLVTKFPLPVLNSFLRAFELVERIAVGTETEVMERYLGTRWAESGLGLGPPPVGDDAVAKMRLLCMAQMNAARVLKGFDELGEDDRDVLCSEMSRSGCVGQFFSQELMPASTRNRPEGPAFLVYYGPAFLQSLGSDFACQRLSVLAEIYRCARALFPASAAKVSANVTVRVDMIKSLSIAEMEEVMHQGNHWIMVKHNDSEVFVEESTARKLNKLVASGNRCQVLDFSCLAPYGP